MFLKLINDLINTNSEQKSLLDTRATSLKNAENRITELSEENKILYEEKKKHQVEKEELKDILEEILDTAIRFPTGNERIALDKIKELVRDYQSKN